MASPETIFGGSTFARISCADATYATAQSGAGTLTAFTSGNTQALGQYLNAGTYNCHQMFLEFDTSVIPSGATVTAATLSVYVSNDYSTTDFTIQARAYDWGASLGTGDFIAGANLTNYTLLASKSTAGGLATNAYTALTSEAAFLSAVNKGAGATTRLFLSSNRQEGEGTQPSGLESLVLFTPAATGETYDPKLVITYTEAGNAKPHYYYAQL